MKRKNFIEEMAESAGGHASSFDFDSVKSGTGKLVLTHNKFMQFHREKGHDSHITMNVKSSIGLLDMHAKVDGVYTTLFGMDVAELEKGFDVNEQELELAANRLQQGWRLVQVENLAKFWIYRPWIENGNDLRAMCRASANGRELTLDDAKLEAHLRDRMTPKSLPELPDAEYVLGSAHNGRIHNRLVVRRFTLDGKTAYAVRSWKGFRKAVNRLVQTFIKPLQNAIIPPEVVVRRLGQYRAGKATT